MYKVEILKDNLQNAAIERRQRLDEERKQRIFNPRVRVMGIDLQALDEQIQIKNKLKAIDKKRNDNLDSTYRHNNDILQLMDEHVIKARRHQLKQTNQFRQDFQQPHQRRDYDLYDPKALQKDHSAREIDGSGVSKEINISSLQRFEGEDLAAKTRLNLQKDQMRVWANEQVYEKERRSQEELDEKRRYEQFQKNITDKMSVLQHSVEVAHRDQACLDREYNMSMAAEKRRKEQQDKVYETELNTREILSHVNGAFLTEKSDMLNTSGSHKVCVSQFKGNTVEQNSKIMEAQQQQRMDHQKLRAAQIDEDERWAIQDTMYSRTMNLLERQKTRSAREKAILIRKENEAKAIQDKDRKRYIDKVLYTNQPQDSYFNQFNTTSR